MWPEDGNPVGVINVDARGGRWEGRGVRSRDSWMGPHQSEGGHRGRDT